MTDEEFITKVKSVIVDTAHEMGVSLDSFDMAMVYWDKQGTCRVFSLLFDNVHMSVEGLKGDRFHTSILINF